MKQKAIKKTEIIIGPLTRAELSRYQSLKEELASQLDIINTAFIKAGRILRQIRDERLYRADFDTFEQFCQSMVGKGKRYVNHIIQAREVVEELLRQGVNESELPNSERLCRELANFPTPELKLIWKRAHQLALKEGKAQPDSITVREAAASINGSPEARRRQIVELLQRFEGIARKMKATGAIGWGDIEPAEIKRLTHALAEILLLAKTHLEGLPKEFHEQKLATRELVKKPTKARKPGKKEKPAVTSGPMSFKLILPS